MKQRIILKIVTMLVKHLDGYHLCKKRAKKEKVVNETVTVNI